jgi:hypothetical protein
MVDVVQTTRLPLTHSLNSPVGRPERRTDARHASWGMLLLWAGVSACSGQARAAAVNASSAHAAEDSQTTAASPNQAGVGPTNSANVSSADAASEPPDQPCADAHRAPGGCKGGFIVAERNSCFVRIESACRCHCNGAFESCRAPKADPSAPPGPVAPEVICSH